MPNNKHIDEIPFNEYEFTGHITKLSNYGDEKCQLCDHDILFQFWIQNTVYENKEDKFIGSECIKKYEINCNVRGITDTDKAIAYAIEIFELENVIAEIKIHWPEFEDKSIWYKFKTFQKITKKQYNLLVDMVKRYKIDTTFFKEYKKIAENYHQNLTKVN